MSAWRDYTPDEWGEISAGTSFDGVPTHQVGLLHRHWIWANYARRTHDAALANDDRADSLDFASRSVWAMYLWYALLYAVIKGLTDRQIKLGSPLVADLRAVREPLREARNATFHVGNKTKYWDMRLFEIARNPESAHQITRVHQALGQLLLDELRRRHAPPGGE
jgi:hypothetical protein